ncbi:MAG TPA: hypothetical protein VFL30_07920, partial [Rhodanobacteraceae bacterium]|nr:hypothetical protein [Rhodanobacteraceae bacterium]
MKSGVVYFVAGVALASFAFAMWLFLNPPEPPIVMSTPIGHSAPSPAPATASAAATPAPAAPASTDPLAALRDADRIADPMQRCLAMPAPRGFEWPKAMIEAFCADELTPSLPWDEFQRAVDDDRVADLDARFDALVEGHFAGRVPEGALRHAYNDNFWGSSK